MGAPIYLVSACTSGEEFVAAFRRYADKNGLFIPIAEPLPPGGRSRFAVTLRDGGVMIEGEAEIVSAARAPSVLHGRVGMTLRFVATDDASKTTLGELERARLSMKPPPPSMPARPADVPAEPRPVPPAPQGRVDAINALAECVAIGEIAGLGPPLPPLAAPPARSGARTTTLPPIPGRTRPTTNPPAAPGAVTAAIPAIAKPEGAVAAAPALPPEPRSTATAVTAAMPPEPRSTATAMTAAMPPEPRSTATAMTAAMPPATRSSAIAATVAMPPEPRPSATVATPPIDPGPTSETMIAATPPVPLPSARTTTRQGLGPQSEELVARGPQSATMTAIPLPSNVPPSAPTEIGGALVVPIDADDEPSARTQVHAGAPRPPPTGTAPVVAPQVTVPGMTPLLRPPATIPSEPQREVAHEAAHEIAHEIDHDIEIAEPTDISMPPEPPSSPSLHLPAEPAPTLPDAEVAGQTDPAAPSTQPEGAGLTADSGAVMDQTALFVRQSDIALGDPDSTPEGAAVRGPDSATDGAVVSISTADLAAEPGVDPADVPGDDAEGSDGADGADGRHSQPRRTVLGVAVGPDGVMVLPAPPTRRPAAAATGDAAPPGHNAERITVGDAAVDAGAPTIPPGSQLIAAAELLTPSRVWLPEDDESSDSAGAAVRPPEPVTPAGSGATLPSGDWMISLDPNAPDGWSAPFHTVPPEHVASQTPSLPAAIAAGRGSPVPTAPAAGEPASTEPKVQIDPSLIASQRAAAGATTADGFEAPAVPGMMAVPQGYPSEPGYADPGYGDPSYTEPSYGGETGYTEQSYSEPGYRSPSYQVMPMPMQPPVLATARSGFGDPRLNHAARRAAARRKHLVIVLITAVVAVLVGIIVMVILRTQHEAVPAPGQDPAAPTAPHAASDPPASTEAVATTEAKPVTGDPASAAAGSAPAGDLSSAPAGSASAAAATASAASAAPIAAAAAAPSPPSPQCFADVSSLPSGADIVIDQKTVIGTTPQRVALPCGGPVELVIRKPRLVAATRTITPTPEGVPLQVALARQTALVKVSSTPAGATVTLGGKSLGVTPTVVKVPAFEASMLTIAKDGYEPDTQRVAPRSSGATVHSVLKRAEHKRPVVR